MKKKIERRERRNLPNYFGDQIQRAKTDSFFIYIPDIKSATEIKNKKFFRMKIKEEDQKQSHKYNQMMHKKSS